MAKLDMEAVDLKAQALVRGEMTSVHSEQEGIAVALKTVVLLTQEIFRLKAAIRDLRGEK